MSNILPELYVHDDSWTYILQNRKLVKFSQLVNPDNTPYVLNNIKSTIVYTNRLYIVYTDLTSNTRLIAFENINGNLVFSGQSTSTLFENADIVDLTIDIHQFNIYLFMTDNDLETTYILSVVVNGVFSLDNVQSAIIEEDSIDRFNNYYTNKIIKSRAFIDTIDANSFTENVSVYDYNYNINKWEFNSHLFYSGYAYKTEFVTNNGVSHAIMLSDNYGLSEWRLTNFNADTLSTISTNYMDEKIVFNNSPTMRVALYKNNIAVISVIYQSAVDLSIAQYTLDLGPTGTFKFLGNIHIRILDDGIETTGSSITDFSVFNTGDNDVFAFIKYFDLDLDDGIEYFKDYVFTGTKFEEFNADILGNTRVFKGGGLFNGGA